jgi:chorismate mutase
MKGSEHNDAFYRERRTGRIRTRTNFAGGILGGISNGEDIVIRVAVKPPSSIPKSQETVDTRGRKRKISVEGRHDPCLCPRVVPVVESMVSLVLADHLIRQTLVSSGGPVKRIRDEIDFIDQNILLLLGQRQELVRGVGRWKKLHRKPILNPKRETEIMRRVIGLAAEADLEAAFVRSVYQQIFKHARAIQRQA